MLSEEALADLVADIRANGLLHPVVLDTEGRIIDGRNRRKACAVAGVEPRFVTFDGDPVAYIIAAHINRRDLRPGQKAMALADLIASFSKQKKYGEQGGLARAGGISPKDLSQALT